jgi:hypothetical protein
LNACCSLCPDRSIPVTKLDTVYVKIPADTILISTTPEIIFRTDTVSGEPIYIFKTDTIRATRSFEIKIDTVYKNKIEFKFIYRFPANKSETEIIEKPDSVAQVTKTVTVHEPPVIIKPSIWEYIGLVAAGFIVGLLIGFVFAKFGKYFV